MELQRAKVLAARSASRATCGCRTCSRSGWWSSRTASACRSRRTRSIPAAFVGVDNTEHTGGDQPARLLAEDGDAAARVRGRGAAVRQERAHPLPDDFGRRRAPAVRDWIRRSRAIRASSCIRSGFSAQVTQRSRRPRSPRRRRRSDRRQRQDGARHHAAGGLIVAGTDTPNAINLHGELMAYTLAGMTPFEALKAATVNPAKALDARRRHDRGRQARRSGRRRRRSARRTSRTRTR